MHLHLPLALLLLSNVRKTVGELLRSDVHLTPAAARPQNELWCYKCSTTEDPETCTDLKYNNNTNLVHKCRDDRRQCMVKRYSYTTSTENTTSTIKLWSLERNCTKTCESGCIIIGERTKLYACTTCCSTSLCNSGSGAEQSRQFQKNLLNLGAVVMTIVIVIYLR